MSSFSKAVMALTGVPKENAVLLCVKAALANPQLVEEYIVLAAKKTGIPQFSVSLAHLEEALAILASSSVFWPKARSLGFGSEYGKPRARPIRRQASSSSSDSSSSDSDDSSSSSSSDGGGGGLDLGFSEDEAAPEPAKPQTRIVQKRKPRKPVAKDSDDDMISAPSEGDAEMQANKSASSSSDSSSSESSSPGEAVSNKKVLKKKLAGLAAQRRAQQAAEAESAKRSTSAPKPAPQTSSEPAPGPASADPPSKPPRKLRQPYAFNGASAKENVRPPPSANTSPSSPAAAEPAVKKPRVETAHAVPSPPAPQESPKATDWSSDFGRLVRQAIDNRRMCPFRTLGLGAASTMAEVKKRWAKLCLLLHPDKAPAEWKSVPELVDANQAVNEAKKSIEQRFHAVALVRPQRPVAHATPFTMDKGTFGKRRIEVRWTPSPVENAREKVERYLVFIVHGQDPRRRDQMVNAGAVKEGTDPFFVIVEDDQRFARFFNSPQMTVSILASNAAGNSDPLTVLIPLR